MRQIIWGSRLGRKSLCHRTSLGRHIFDSLLSLTPLPLDASEPSPCLSMMSARTISQVSGFCLRSISHKPASKPFEQGCYLCIDQISPPPSYVSKSHQYRSRSERVLRLTSFPPLKNRCTRTQNGNLPPVENLTVSYLSELIPTGSFRLQPSF